MERVRGRGGRGTHELAGLVARAEVVRLTLLVREVVLGAPDARLEDACERSHEARVSVRSDSRSHDEEETKESDAPSSSLNLMMTASLGGRFLLRTCWTSNANLQPRVHAHETWKCLGQSSHLMVAPTPLTWQRAHFCRQEGATSQEMHREREEETESERGNARCCGAREAGWRTTRRAGRSAGARPGARGARWRTGGVRSCAHDVIVSRCGSRGGEARGRDEDALLELGRLEAVEGREGRLELEVARRRRAEDAVRVQVEPGARLVALAQVAQPLVVRPLPVEVDAVARCAQGEDVSIWAGRRSRERESEATHLRGTRSCSGRTGTGPSWARTACRGGTAWAG